MPPWASLLCNVLYLWYSNPCVWWIFFSLNSKSTKQPNSHLHKALCEENNAAYLHMKLKSVSKACWLHFRLLFFFFNDNWTLWWATAPICCHHFSSWCVNVTCKIYIRSSWYIFGEISMNMNLKWSEVKWRSSTGQRVYIACPSWSSFRGWFVNSACLLCASGMAAEQKVCCLGALSRLTHPHPPSFHNDGRWLLMNPS